MKRVLVTGAGGFIGTHAVPLLVERGFEVHAVTRDAARLRAGGVIPHRCDLLDEGAIERIMSSVTPSHLLHLAWYTTPGLFCSSLKNLDWAPATLALFRAFIRHGGTRAVLAGSCAEYGYQHRPLAENSPLNPTTLYGACKAALPQRLHELCAGSRTTFAWARVFSLYGPHEPRERLIPSTILALLEGRPARFTAGTQVRDYLHVRDVAAAFAALVDGELQGEINVASGQPVTVGAVVRRLGELMGRPDLIRLGEIATPEQDADYVVADVTRLRATGFSPSYTLETGLRSTIDWWREASHSEIEPVEYRTRQKA